MAHEMAYVNGRVVPVGEATVSVYDRSFLYGDGCFDTAVARRGRVFKLEAHVERLLRSMQVLRIPAPMTREGFRETALDLLRRNQMVDGFLRIVISRGTCAYVSLDPRTATTGPTVVMLTRGAEPPREIAGIHGDTQGIRAVTASVRKTPAASLESRVKANNYLNGILARWEAIDAGVDEAILLDAHGLVTEGTGDNLFAVCRGRLVTPPALNILEGITRETILAIAPTVPVAAEVREMTPYDLYTADEVFLTSTVIGVQPILELDGRTIGSGKRGPVAERLQALYDEVLLRDGTPIA
jgi:branched-chain amino acid aminotransferase